MKVFILVSSALFFFSCKSTIIEPQQNNESNFKYPFKTGSFWYYTSRNFISDIRPDSIRIYFSSDTTLSFGTSTFLNDTVLNISDTVKIFKNEITSGHGILIKEYYKQTDSGLIRYASGSNLVGFGPYRSGSQPVLISGNKIYNSPFEIFHEINESYSSDSLIYDNPPKTALKYPLAKDASWTLSNNGSTRIDKVYIDFENVNLPAGNFYCMKVQKKFYFNNSSNPDNNFLFYDYFSKEGMIKRDYSIKNIQVTNSQGQHIGFIDAKEEILLNFYSLP